MKKITVENCRPNTRAVVSDVRSSTRNNIGAKLGGLICFPFNPEGMLLSDELELVPGTLITIYDGPKRFNGLGNQVKFTLDGDPTIYSAWWSYFKAKIEPNISPELTATAKAPVSKPNT